MFPFQAIHNYKRCVLVWQWNVKELLSCFLFKQFTTFSLIVFGRTLMSKSYYRVSFSSNSQLHRYNEDYQLNVKELLSCFLFKQFTTQQTKFLLDSQMSKSYYRVSFSSNSQRILFKNYKDFNVKELLSCFLFKQFTTYYLVASVVATMSKSYYRVSFSSNSQLNFNTDAILK